MLRSVEIKILWNIFYKDQTAHSFPSASFYPFPALPLCLCLFLIPLSHFRFLFCFLLLIYCCLASPFLNSAFIRAISRIRHTILLTSYNGNININNTRDRTLKSHVFILNCIRKFNGCIEFMLLRYVYVVVFPFHCLCQASDFAICWEKWIAHC